MKSSDLTLDLAKKQRPSKKISVNMRATGWISPYLIYFFSRYSIPPNLITFSWIVLAFVGFYFIALGNYIYTVIGILIYHLALLLDSTDGGVARILGKTNAGGEFLDRLDATVREVGEPLNRSLQDIAIIYIAKSQKLNDLDKDLQTIINNGFALLEKGIFPFYDGKYNFAVYGKKPIIEFLGT